MANKCPLRHAGLLVSPQQQLYLPFRFSGYTVLFWPCCWGHVIPRMPTDSSPVSAGLGLPGLYIFSASAELRGWQAFRTCAHSGYAVNEHVGHCCKVLLAPDLQEDRRAAPLPGEHVWLTCALAMARPLS